MNNQVWNRNSHVRGSPGSGSLRRLALLFLLLVMLLQACSIDNQTSSTAAVTPVKESAQVQTVNPPNEPTHTPGKNPVHESVLSPSSSPTSVPTLTPTLTPSPSPTGTHTPEPTDTPASQSPVVFAVIGDYGSGEPKEGEVADLVTSWSPEFIITVGDNNYPTGDWDDIDVAVGQFYHSYIYPYKGSYGEGAEVNRFFPTIGNHDAITDNAQPYLDYFTLPGNERYYDFVWGPLHFFALNDVEEPDGVNESSTQAMWLQQKLAESTSPWNIVYMHYPPYSSGKHGSTDWAQWPYAEWEADVVLAGHNHVYERLEVDGLTYFVNGLGGVGTYDFKDTVEGSLVRYNSDLGAMRVEATDQSIRFEFITRGNEVIDTFEMRK